MKERQSNIELLRIIAITMVLMLHFNVQGWHPGIYTEERIFSLSLIEGHIIESLCISAVNIFVLISGYFSIKLSIKSILNLYIRCFIIGLITYLAYLLIAHEPATTSALVGRALAFTHNHWWFVISYLGLIAISPILNAGCEALSKRNYLYVLSMLSIAMIYFGWYKNWEITNAGYSLIHFIYLYIIARYIKLHVSNQLVRQHRWTWFLLFALLVVVLVVFALFNPPYAYAYNNPIVIAIAICLLLFSISMPFYNRYINWCAASVFSAYLIQESPYFGRLLLYPKTNELFANGLCGGGAILFAILVASTLIISIVVDKIFVMPVIKYTNKKYDKIFNHSTAV